MKYVLDIVPVPASRPRFSRFGTHYGKKHTAFQKEVKPLVVALDMSPLEGAIKLDVIFYMKIPTSLSKRRREVLDGQWHISRPDTDNYLKLLLDSIQGYAFNDDSQVCHIDAKKIYSTRPRIEFELNNL